MKIFHNKIAIFILTVVLLSSSIPAQICIYSHKGILNSCIKATYETGSCNQQHERKNNKKLGEVSQDRDKETFLGFVDTIFKMVWNYLMGLGFVTDTYIKQEIEKKIKIFTDAKEALNGALIFF